MDQLARHINELRHQIEWFCNTGDTLGYWSSAVRESSSRIAFELAQPTINWGALVADLRLVMAEVPFLNQAPHAWYFAVGISTCLDPTALQCWNEAARVRYFELTNEMVDLIAARRAEAATAQECWLRSTALNQAAIAIFGQSPAAVRH